MSEAPVLQPLIPLHDFIEKLGRPPDKDALTIYIARLREMASASVPELCKRPKVLKGVVLGVLMRQCVSLSMCSSCARDSQSQKKCER